jgi:hypothetical protein
VIVLWSPEHINHFRERRGEKRGKRSVQTLFLIPFTNINQFKTGISNCKFWVLHIPLIAPDMLP